MNICPTCGKKFIREDYFNNHVKVHEALSNPEPVTIESPKEIVLHFTKPVEITINGHRWEGKEILAKDFEEAAELLRMAREAYGYEILA